MSQEEYFSVSCKFCVTIQPRRTLTQPRFCWTTHSVLLWRWDTKGRKLVVDWETGRHRCFLTTRIVTMFTLSEYTFFLWDTSQNNGWHSRSQTTWAPHQSNDRLHDFAKVQICSQPDTKWILVATANTTHPRDVSTQEEERLPRQSRAGCRTLASPPETVDTDAFDVAFFPEVNDSPRPWTDSVAKWYGWPCLSSDLRHMRKRWSSNWYPHNDQQQPLCHLITLTF